MQICTAPSLHKLLPCCTSGRIANKVCCLAQKLYILHKKYKSCTKRFESTCCATSSLVPPPTAAASHSADLAQIAFSMHLRARHQQLVYSCTKACDLAQKLEILHTNSKSCTSGRIASNLYILAQKLEILHRNSRSCTKD